MSLFKNRTDTSNNYELKTYFSSDGVVLKFYYKDEELLFDEENNYEKFRKNLHSASVKIKDIFENLCSVEMEEYEQIEPKVKLQEGFFVISNDAFFDGIEQIEKGADNEPFTTLLSEILENTFIPYFLPVKFCLESKGIFSNSGFKISWIIRDINGFIAIPKLKNGPYLKLEDGRELLLSKVNFELLKLLEPKWVGSEKENMLRWAKIKPIAIEAGAELDIYLKNENAIFLEGVFVKHQSVSDREISLKPSLGNEKLDSKFLRKFELFNNNILERYDMDEDGERFRVLFGEKAQYALSYLRENSVVRDNEVEDFLLDPQVYIKDKFEAWLGRKKIKIENEKKFVGEESPKTEKTVEEVLTEYGFLSGYSDRVTGIGQWKAPSIAGLTESKSSQWWFDWTENISSQDKQSDIGEDKISNLSDSDTSIGIVGEEGGFSSGIKQDSGDIKNLDGASISNSDTKEESNIQKKEDSLQIITNISKNDMLYGESTDKVYPENYEENIPASHNKDLPFKSHQKYGYNWLVWRSKKESDPINGGLLADDMGLGKTYQVISLLAFLYESKKCSPSLVVAPLSLLENWENEIRKFYPNLFKNIVWIRGKYPKLSLLENADIILSSYESIRSRQKELGVINWNVVVCDEAQKIKNVKTKVSHAIKAMKAKTRIAITGTPVENSFSDLWNIIDFVQPSHLGSLGEFRDRIIKPWRNCLEEEKKRLVSELQCSIKPIFLRRTKSEVLKDLPPIKHSKYHTGMTKVQQKLYRTILDKYQKSKGNKCALGVMQNLLKVCIHPDLFIHYDSVNFVKSSMKLDKTIDILKDIKHKKEKVVIFCNLIKMQTILQDSIGRHLDLTPSVINGYVTGKSSRQNLINKFSNKDGFNIIILSPKTAGFGLNIVAANHVIHYTREWNPAVEAQCTDRVYRIGQTKEVSVYYPIVKGTGFVSLEEKLDELLENKKKMLKSVLVPCSELNINEGMEAFINEDILHTNERTPLRIKEINKLDPITFEKTVKILMGKIGYKKTYITPRREDYGTDVVCIDHPERKNSLIQVKHSQDENKIGPRAVDEVYGSKPIYEKEYNLTFPNLMVISNSYFTKNCKIKAKCLRVELIGKNDLQKLMGKHPIFFDDLL